ncbi:putative ribonuclease H-like domain-containing protein [Tanacetum coccineum]
MSSMGELTFFLGLQVMQRDDGIFISQDKYVADILKKFDFVIMKTTSTLIETNKALLKDEEAEDVDVHLYRSMMGSLMYLTASRPDIIFVVCACDSPFDLEAFSDSDYAGASLDMKSTTGGCQFLGKRCYGSKIRCLIIEIRHHFIRDSYEKKLIHVIKSYTDHNVADLLTKAFDVSRKAKRTTEISQSSGPILIVTDDTVIKEWEDRMERAATTASSLEAKQDSVVTLVAKGYTQEEGIDYNEVFALVARIEAIRLFFAYASFMGFIVYQMYVKSAFLYGTIEEEVCVCQPPGFENPQFPDKVYKVYVDDIIFGSTKKSLCTKFESLIHKKFQMSSMGELTFFLGLQVMQRDDGIFISQDKYVADILKKFDFVTMKTTSSPIKTNKALLKDEEAEDVDVYLYRSMIGSLMYLTASKLDIIYLKGQPKLGLWYPRDSPFDLEAFSDSDYAGPSLDRKSTTGGVMDLKSND